MATPLAVPVVDLPVVWWPWRPRHHHYYCIISFRVFMFLVVFGCCFLLFEENLFYFC